MNIPVNYTIAKLLKEKGFNKEKCKEYFTDGTLSISNEPKEVFMEAVKHNKVISCLAPTIVDVVMWLYEKHSIWISVYQYKDHAADNNDPILFRSKITGRNEWLNESYSPTKEYEAAFEYTLNSLIEKK
jgi:hypothetical protein